MTLKQEQEQELIINDLFLIAKAVKEHLKEPNCTHNIRSIVKQALESKNGLRPPTTPNPAEDHSETNLNVQTYSG